MKKVLILDNDESVLDVMNEALAYEGFAVKTLENSDNIFHEIESFGPDLVIVDYILNGVDGGEVCQQIKVGNKTSNLPVILMSAYPKVFKPLKDYGCDDFIAKPFDLDDFVVRIKKLMNDGMNKNLHAI